MKKKVISNKPYCEAQFMAIESDIEKVFSKSLFESIIICPLEELVVSGNNNLVVVSYEKGRQLLNEQIDMKFLSPKFSGFDCFKTMNPNQAQDVKDLAGEKKTKLDDKLIFMKETLKVGC